MKLDLLKNLAAEARAIEEAIRPLMPDIGEKGYVSNEIWVSANGVAEDLEQAYADALSEDALEQAAFLVSRTSGVSA